MTPPIRHAATPVEAVTTVPSGGRVEMIFLSRKDFPVPAEPVKKTLRPRAHSEKQVNEDEVDLYFNSFTLKDAVLLFVECFHQSRIVWVRPLLNSAHWLY